MLLDSLRADAIFGWRQLQKNKVTSLAAILSLGLAIGACTSAFRLVDALLLRPLPIADPQHLYALSRAEIGFDGQPQNFGGWAYPDFQLMRAAAKGQAELIAVSSADRTDLTYTSDDAMEKAHVQYVSGWMFGSFGIRPAAGRLLTENDDRRPGAHPYAVISYDYWSHRFGRDPKAVGRTFHLADRIFEIVGVSGQDFTGTEPGTFVDVFVPTMMHRSVTRSDSTWHNTFAMVKPGVPIEPLRAKLSAVSLAFERERAKSFTGMPQKSIDDYLNQKVLIEPAPSGVSDLQSGNRSALAALSVLVALVLLIACANVANLMTAQAAARAREMALRVSIGAGRGRLVQLVLIESAMLATLAATLGAFFAWRAAPFVVGLINPPDNPARLDLPADWRVFGFGLVLTLTISVLFGIVPALRASSVQPAVAMKGGDDPHARGRMMNGLIALQVAFCFLVLFVAGLFVTTFERLSNQSTGFSADRLLTLDTLTQQAQPAVYWSQVADRLRRIPGVESVALASWPLLRGTASNNFVTVNGAPPGTTLAYFLSASPGFLGTMRIPLIDGRDFRASDTAARGAIVNETFARTYFKGADPVGKSFDEAYDDGSRAPHIIVGLVRDFRYRGMREAILPVAFLPFDTAANATFLVKTSGPNTIGLATALRREVGNAHAGFRVTDARTQQELIDAQTVRERLLAMLALFFAVVALVLAGIGLYGVLNYSVIQRRREIGIRMAIGARSGNIAWRVTSEVFAMVLLGAFAGALLGMTSARYVESLFYQVKATDAAALAIPSLTILAAALLSALPAILQAVRVDPASVLRAE